MADRDTEPEDAGQDDGRTAGDATGAAAPAAGDPPLPADVVTRAVTLTRRLRQAVDDDERAAFSAERDRLLADHDYVARVREDAAGETLVLYPDEWIDDGVVRVDRVEDTAARSSCRCPASGATTGTTSRRTTGVSPTASPTSTATPTARPPTRTPTS